MIAIETGDRFVDFYAYYLIFSPLIDIIEVFAIVILAMRFYKKHK
jgi:hypothetical protein